MCLKNRLRSLKRNMFSENNLKLVVHMFYENFEEYLRTINLRIERPMHNFNIKLQKYH